MVRGFTVSPSRGSPLTARAQQQHAKHDASGAEQNLKESLEVEEVATRAGVACY